MKRKWRKPRPFVDEDGVHCLEIFLARGQGIALVFRSRYAALVSGGISERWNLNGNSDGFGYVKSYRRGRGGTVTIAREILGLSKGDGLRARHRNRKLFDLRDSNLYAERNPAPPSTPLANNTQDAREPPTRRRPFGVRRGPQQRPRKPWYTTDEDGVQCAQVRLADWNEKVKADAADYRQAVAGGLSVCWQAVSNGRGKRYVYAHHLERGTVQVARELLGMTRGDERRVSYHNGDTFDLRRSNLVISKPGARKLKTERHRR